MHIKKIAIIVAVCAFAFFSACCSEVDNQEHTYPRLLGIDLEERHAAMAISDRAYVRCEGAPVIYTSAEKIALTISATESKCVIKGYDARVWLKESDLNTIRFQAIEWPSRRVLKEEYGQAALSRMTTHINKAAQ